MNQEMAMVMRKNEEREALRSVIAQWNANRLDLFELSEPNQDLEFHGVMRFYFQDSGQKVATKCIRVASDATATVVIETLIEKFRPDMRMLSIPEYALYEIHENGEERRLEPEEKPLLVQLNWHKDDREGRFLLRRIDDKTNMPDTFQEGSSFRRKLSKREKKQIKKQEKMNRLKPVSQSPNDENDAGVAEKLYTELPETSFTRSISNPEAVMRRRRQQKLEKKLQQFRSKDGGPDTGGTLKIYGEALCRDVPYKTLLLSIGDTASQVVKEMLAKYGLTKEEPTHYCLVQVNTAVEETKETNGNNNTINNREYILDDDECPLAILMNHPMTRGSIMFHVRRRPADYHPRKRKKKPQQGKWGPPNEMLDYRYEDGVDRLPFFLELNPDGSDIGGGTAKRYRLQPNVTEVGSERGSPHGHGGQSLQLFGPNIQPRHCVIAHTEGIVTVTPCSRDAETYVNGQRIYETTILLNGTTVKFGRIHTFRFLDPCHEERTRNRHDSSRSPHDYSYDRQSTREETSSLSVTNGPTNASTPSGNPLNYETTFDVDGNVETRSTSSQGKQDDARSQRSVSIARELNRLPNYDRYPRGTDPILPAVLEIREETEEALLHAIITDLEPSSPAFKVAPSYTLYLIARYRASTHYRPELTPTERAHRLTLMLARVAAMIHNVIQERYCDVKGLAMWLANASELLHFLKCDRHISAFSLDAQDTLADAVQIGFRHLVACLQGELSTVMPSFLSDRDDLSHDPEDSSTASVLGVLSSAMNLLRWCRVNAALTIQLFSQLFYYINVWAFNRVVAPNSIYCSRIWGLRLKARLAQIEVWAERQGLELAADCHLARLMQAAHLLQAPKYTCDDLAALSSTCFKLNSLQLRALLQRYQPSPDEPRIPHDIVDNVVRVAENLADELARSDGREVRLEEDPELALSFLLPDDGYSCEVVRGVPPGLVDFIAPLQQAGLCRLTAQPTSNGLWTVYMGPVNSMMRSPSAMSNRSSGFVPTQHEPEVQIIKLHKSNNGMGLSIVAAKGAGQDRLGIYIKSVVKGGAADADGRLQAGDQLLKVDGQSLVGITQEKAAEYLVRTGPIVTLEVAKQGAIYHGLATLLSQPSPIMARASTARFSQVMDSPGPYEGLPKAVSLNSLRDRSFAAAAAPLLYEFEYQTGEPPYYCSAPSHPSQSQHRPVSPNTLQLTVPIITTTPPLPDPPRTTPITPNNYLSVPARHANCYKASCSSNFDLSEDIFQEHQARLINCDSEDASAFLHRPNDLGEKADIVRFPTKIDAPAPDWLNLSLERANKSPPPGRWYPLSHAKPWKSDIYLTKSGEWKLLGCSTTDDDSYRVKVPAQRSKSADDLVDHDCQHDQVSSSDCECNNDSISPKSTDSSDPPTKIENTLSSCLLTDATNDSKLTKEERLKALKELDEIVGGMDKISQFARMNFATETALDVKDLVSPLPTVDALSSQISPVLVPGPSDSSTSGSSNQGDFEYGSGRVAALAKHFSKMGEAGIIRGRGAKFTRDRIKSEPTINFSNSEMSPKPGDIILPPQAFMTDNHPDFNLIFKSNGLKPVGFSMDRLVDIGHERIVVQEIKPAMAQKAHLPDNETVSVQTSPNGDTSSNLAQERVQFANPWYKQSPTRLNSPKPTPKCSPVLLRRKPPALDPLRKSISVDEMEMKRQTKPAGFHKHYSLVELVNVDKPKPLDKKNGAGTPALTVKPLEQETLRNGQIPFRGTRCWMSVDDSAKPWPSHVERPKDRDRLDDALHKKCKLDAIKGRKNRRIKKLELQRSFVVTPIKFGHLGHSEDAAATIWFHNYDRNPDLGEDSLDASRPRRMSERDLPSRVLSEQQNQPGRPQLPPHAPQMHSSKSVPSLNTGSHELERPMMNLNQTVAGNSNTMPKPNHEVFNPGYSRTSSTNSIPQKSYDGQIHPNQHHIRSRSSQNLADQRQPVLPMNHANHRPPPSANILHPNNMANYQPPPYTGGPQQHPQGHPGHPGPPYQGQPPQPGMAPHPAYHPHPPQHSQQPLDSPGADGERFYQNLSIYRNQDVIPNGYAQPQNGISRGKMPSPQDERTPMNVNKMQPSLRGSQSSLQSRSTSDGTNQMVRDRPASAYLPNNYHPQLPPQGMQARSQSSRDMLRQEAKIQEMTEEVRRREMRVTSPQQRPLMTQGGVVGAPMQGSPLRYPQGGPYADNGPLGGYAPNHNSTASGRLSQQPPDYADSPPPPPPPPSTTHPLYQTQRGPEPARYAASGGEPPRGSYFPSPGNQQDKQQYLYQGSNPWQREEKEREAERRRNAARHWRDQQINELLSLPNRNPQQEEHLRALKLEREFERRAEELEEEEEEDQEAAERVQGLLRVAQQKDERRSVRGPAPQLSSNQNSPNQQQPYSPHTTPTSQTNGPIARTPLSTNQMPSSYSSSSAEEKARLQRLKELRMKQAEVEAERMKKKQEEELRSQGIEPVSSTHMTSRTAAMNSSSTMSRTLTSTSNLRLDNLVINTPANVTPNSHYHNNNGYSSSQASPAGQRLDMMLGQTPNGNAPLPPERGSSFAIMSQTQNVNTSRTTTSTATASPLANNNNNINNSQMTTPTAKRVSFQDPTPPPPPSNPAPPLDNIHEDPNHFINEAENMLASPTSPETPFTGNTPGVIGAQEVYRDPRQRRLAEQQHQKMMTKGAIPEQLSFKEKMKMFAMETGEDATPKDKVKISRAQRDIDNIGSPTTPNNNTSAQGD